MLEQRTDNKQLFSHLLRKYQGKLKWEWICDFCLFQKDSVGRFMRKPFPNTLNLYGTLISKALPHLLALWSPWRQVGQGSAGWRKAPQRASAMGPRRRGWSGTWCPGPPHRPKGLLLLPRLWPRAGQGPHVARLEAKWPLKSWVVKCKLALGAVLSLTHCPAPLCPEN